MNYIITKLNIKKLLVQVINDVYNSEEDAFKYIMDMITENKDVYYVNKIKNNKLIEVYKINKGYMYNSKKLIYIYQILKIPNSD